jgi:putative glutamine amidotransferase
MSTSDRPINGILCGVKELRKGIRPTRRSYSADGTYVEAVRSVGGLPILLAPIPAEIDAYVRLADGFLFMGGRDLPPELYGGRASAPELLVPEARARFELELVRRSIAANHPLLGICLGCQVLNVAQGGGLHQDLALDDGRFIAHDGNDLSYVLTHPVHIESGTRLAEILGKPEIEVNSFHHQAASTPGRGLKVSARAPDGVIEALEHPDRDFVVGVQWHPEENPEDPATHALFGALVAAARRFRSRG